MPFDITYLLYGGIFLAALLLIEGLYFLHADSRGGREAVNRRMRMIEGGATTREVFETLRRSRREKATFLGPLGDLGTWLDDQIQQAGLTVSLTRICVMMMALTVGIFISILLLTKGAVAFAGLGGFVSVLIVSAALGVALPILYLRYLGSKRLQLFAEQLPDALDVMVRSLHAGHPISAAMSLVTKEMPDPIGSEFGVAVDEMTYGLDLRDALGNLGERVDVEDFRYVIVAINIQHDTGGNLAEVLDGLSKVIRARFNMFKKIRALSAEGRLSAKILAIMPFLFGGFVYFSKPGYYDHVAGDPLFFSFLGVAFVLELFGIYVMYRLVNFRV